MAELTADRATDARVAAAMGLTVVSQDWPCGREPECGCYEASTFVPPIGSWWNEFGPVVADENGWPPRVEAELGDGREVVCAYVEPVAFYLIDPAQVTVMLDRLVALLGDTGGDTSRVSLMRYSDDEGWDLRIETAGKWHKLQEGFDAAYYAGEFEAPTANEAAAKALLWVWERRDKGVDDLGAKWGEKDGG